MKQLINKSKRVSIIDTSLISEAKQQTEEDMAQEYFKNTMYII